MRMTKLFGKPEKQRKQHGIKKVATAAALTAAVALAVTVTGVLPGEGLQEAVTVEAAEDDESQPKKGTMEFWQWERVWESITFKEKSDTTPSGVRTYIDQVYDGNLSKFKKPDQWEPILPIFKADGNYYVPTGKLRVANGSFKAAGIKSLSPFIDPDVDSFITRPISDLLEIKYNSSTTGYFQMRESTSGAYISMEKIMTADYHRIGTLINSAEPSNWNFEVDNHGTDWGSLDGTVLTFNKFVFRNDAPWKGGGSWSDYIDPIFINSNFDSWNEGVAFEGTMLRDWYNITEEEWEAMDCELYVASKKYYTCINENWSIGANQVYTADSDLILKDGVTLTVPEGAVLCVKKGAFFVNGIISCYGTILVEDGGIIMPYQASGENGRGCYISLKTGGTMIIEEGGRVYAGCPAGQLGTKNQGWLDMHEGSTLVNYGLLVAGKCDFNLSGSGGGTIENHPGGAMFLGYTVDDPTKFMGVTYDASRTKAETLANALGLKTTGGYVGYAVDGSATTFLETWEGSALATANNTDKRSVKIYARDKDYKYTEKTWKPN